MIAGTEQVILQCEARLLERISSSIPISDGDKLTCLILVDAQISFL
jgi:hypothetical protein